MFGFERVRVFGHNRMIRGDYWIRTKNIGNNILENHSTLLNTDSIQINVNKTSSGNPRFTPSQSSKPCTVLQYPSRKVMFSRITPRYSTQPRTLLQKRPGLFAKETRAFCKRALTNNNIGNVLEHHSPLLKTACSREDETRNGYRNGNRNRERTICGSLFK